MEWSVYSRLSKLGCELELLGGEFPLLASLAVPVFHLEGWEPSKVLSLKVCYFSLLWDLSVHHPLRQKDIEHFLEMSRNKFIGFTLGQ